MLCVYVRTCCVSLIMQCGFISKNIRQNTTESPSQCQKKGVPIYTLSEHYRKPTSVPQERGPNLHVVRTLQKAHVSAITKGSQFTCHQNTTESPPQCHKHGVSIYTSSEHYRKPTSGSQSTRRQKTTESPPLGPSLHVVRTLQKAHLRLTRKSFSAEVLAGAKTPPSVWQTSRASLWVLGSWWYW